MSRPYQQEVTRGINLLTRKLGLGFRERIDPDRLDTHSCYDCPLGQLYGRFIDGVKRLRLTGETVESNGFHIKELDESGPFMAMMWIRAREEFKLLDAEWKRQLWGEGQ